MYASISGTDCSDAFGADCPDLKARFILRELTGAVPASVTLLPTPGKGIEDDTWSKDEVIVETPSKNYSAYDMVEVGHAGY